MNCKVVLGYNLFMHCGMPYKQIAFKCRVTFQLLICIIVFINTTLLLDAYTNIDTYNKLNNQLYKSNPNSIQDRNNKLHIQKAVIYDTKHSLDYYLNLALHYRDDLKDYNNSYSSDGLLYKKKSFYIKWNPIKALIKQKYHSLNSVLKERKEAAGKLSHLYERLDSAREIYKLKKIDSVYLSTIQSKLSLYRKKIIKLEANIKRARASLYSSCGISPKMLKRPSIATLNEAQDSYINAQKAYIKAEIGVLDSRAGLSSATGR